MTIQLDAKGYPVWLADVPGSGAHTIDPDARSGNPAHDTRSGKFASKGKKDQPSNPPNVDPVEFQRMLDAVRDAAREFDTPDIGDIKQFLSGRARDPARVDVEDFLQRVREQRLADLVDILDQQFRTKISTMKTGRRRVRVVAPRGFVKRVIAGLTPQEFATVAHRLEAKGHDPEDVEKLLVSRAKEKDQQTVRDHKATLSDPGDDSVFSYNL